MAHTFRKLMIHRTQHKRGEGETGKRFKEKDRDLPPKLKTQVWQNRGKKLPTANRCKQSKLPHTKANCNMCPKRGEKVADLYSEPKIGQNRVSLAMILKDYIPTFEVVMNLSRCEVGCLKKAYRERTPEPITWIPSLEQSLREVIPVAP